jgi:hypothetical protein
LAEKARSQAEVANNRAEAAKEQAQVAEQELAQIQAELAQVQGELAQIEREKVQVNQDLTEARDQFTVAKAELTRSQADLQDAEAQRQVVYDQLKQAEQEAQGQEALLGQLEQDLVDADAAVALAEQAKQAAQRKTDQAANDLLVVEQALAEVSQEQQEIATLNDTTKAFSGLIDDLYAIDKPEAARDAIEQIGLSFTDFTDDSPELKQALLKSSTALAHLHLIPFSSDDAQEEAQERIDKAQTLNDQSIQLIEANPNLFNSSESGRAIAFFTYAVQGNLREEQDSTRASVQK